MNDPKFDENGARICDNVDCDMPATHTLVWNEQMCYCIIHANQALNIADAMGFNAPMLSLRMMTFDEMCPSVGIESQQRYIMGQIEVITDKVLDDNVSMDLLSGIADLLANITEAIGDE